MPLTLSYTAGALPEGADALAIERITAAFLKCHGLAGNRTMTPNVTAQVHCLATGATFSGGRPFSGVWVEWKVPSFALADQDIRRAFFAEVTRIIRDLTDNRQPEEHIFINVVHAVDGGWSLNGGAMTNRELAAVIGEG